MSKVLVECEWLILTADRDDFREILRLAEVLECELWVKEDRRFVDGYQVISIFASSDAEKIVELFRDAVQRYAQFSQGRGSKYPLQRLASLRGLTPEIWSPQAHDLFYFFESAALHNQHIRDHLPIWIAVSWVIKSIATANLESVVHMAQAENALITYQIKKLMQSEVQFYIKFSHPYGFVTFMTNVKKLMQVRHWSVMFSPQSYKDIDYDKIQAYPHLTHNTIPAFLEAIDPYL